MRFPQTKRRISFAAQLFGSLVLLMELWNNGYVDKKQRTIDFLRGASMNLKHTDIPNNTALFPSMDAQVCMIAKNGHSAIQYVSCILAANELGNSEAEDGLLTYSTFYGAFTHICERFRPFWGKENDDRKKIVFIRDPLERFISGWLFVCKRHKLCLECGLDISCFLTTMFNCWNTNMEYSKTCTFIPPSFPRNFVFYHMSPQAAHCKLRDKDVLKNYKVIKYEREAVNDFLLRAARPSLNEKRYDHLSQLLNKPTDHASTRADMEGLKMNIASNKELAVMFSILYFIDYDTFAIDLPQFILNLDIFDPVYKK